MTTRRPCHIYSTFHVEALEIAQRLTQGERRWLMDHANGPRPLIRVEDALIRDKATTKRIIERPRSLRPQFTFLTDFGREVLIIVLQKEIERLVAAGCAATGGTPSGQYGYTIDGRNSVVVDPYSLCWRTGFWSYDAMSRASLSVR